MLRQINLLHESAINATEMRLLRIIASRPKIDKIRRKNKKEESGYEEIKTTDTTCKATTKFKL